MSNYNPKKNASSKTADTKPYKPVLGNCYPALSFQFITRLREEMLIAIGDERDHIGDNFYVGDVWQDEDHEESLLVRLLGVSGVVRSGVVLVRYIHGNGHIWYNEGGSPPKMHGLKGVGVIPTSGEFVREEDKACPRMCAQLVVNFLLRGVAPWDHDYDKVQSDDKSPETGAANLVSNSVNGHIASTVRIQMMWRGCRARRKLVPLERLKRAKRAEAMQGVELLVEHLSESIDTLKA